MIDARDRSDLPSDELALSRDAMSFPGGKLAAALSSENESSTSLHVLTSFSSVAKLPMLNDLGLVKKLDAMAKMQLQVDQFTALNPSISASTVDSAS
jgi:hypothetical protein